MSIGLSEFESNTTPCNFLVVQSSNQRSKHDELYFVGFVSTFFASNRKSRTVLNNASFSRHSLVSFVLLLNYKFHASRDLFLILTNLHLHFEIRSAYLSAHLRKFYRFLSCHLPTSRQNNSHYYTARKPTGKRK